VAGAEVASIELAGDEVSEWRMVAPAELDRYVTAPMAGRLRSLLAGASYLEEGDVVLDADR
jgi:hypothetical protein